MYRPNKRRDKQFKIATIKSLKILMYILFISKETKTLSFYLVIIYNKYGDKRCLKH